VRSRKVAHCLKQALAGEICDTGYPAVISKSADETTSTIPNAPMIERGDQSLAARSIRRASVRRTTAVETTTANYSIASMLYQSIGLDCGDIE
jgi:hypothetical protein